MDGKYPFMLYPSALCIGRGELIYLIDEYKTDDEREFQASACMILTCLKGWTYETLMDRRADFFCELYAERRRGGVNLSIRCFFFANRVRFYMRACIGSSLSTRCGACPVVDFCSAYAIMIGRLFDNF